VSDLALSATRPSPPNPRQETLTRLDAAVHAAQTYLLSLQRKDGHWCGELEGDTILESEYILVMHFLGRGSDPKVRKAGNYLRVMQRPQGGWAIYPGGPVEVSASVKAYFSLKLLGDHPDLPHMARARERILEAGGLDACNSFTKIYLAIFGQYDWSRCPSVPPELMLAPRWFPLNIYAMSSWSRGILVPLTIISARRPRHQVPDQATISELVAPGYRPKGAKGWGAFFHRLDAGIKRLEALPWSGARRAAIARARQLLDAATAEAAATERTDNDNEAPATAPTPAQRCPSCSGRMIVVETFAAGTAPRLRPSALIAAIRIDTS